MSEIIDPISGLQANPLIQPEVVLESARKKQSSVRALMDIRLINNPEQDVNILYHGTKADVDQGLSDEYMQQELLGYAAKQEQAALEAAQQVDVLDETSVARSQAILENINVIGERFSDVDGYYQAVTDYNAPDTLESFRAEEAAVKGRAYQILEERAEELGTLETAVNWATSILQHDYLKDASDLVDGSIFESPEQLHTAIKDFQTRTPAEQAVLIEEIVPAMWEAYDHNHVKVGSLISTLFDKAGSGSDIILGVGFDIAVGAEALHLATKASRGIMSSRSLASRAVDAEGIEAAASRQAVAGVDDAGIEDAIGVKKADAAHSANPMPTRAVDEGASIDDIAGEIDIVKQRQIKAFTEELLPISGNKLDRGTFKALMREKTAYQKTLAQLKIEKQAVSTSSKGGAKVGQARKRQTADINNDMAIIQEKLAIVQRRIDANKAPVQAEADLSRLQQGIIPDRYQAQYAKAVEEAKASMREQNASRQAREEAKKEAPKTEDKSENELNKEAVQNLGVVQEVKTGIASLLEDVITPTAFTPEEQALAITRAQERLSAELTDAGQSINSMNVIERSKEGFTLKYSTTSGEAERSLLFTRDDVGSVISENDARTFKQKWQNLFGRVFSPDVLLQDVFPDLVKDATFTGQQSAKLRNGLANLWKQSEAGLGKKERFEVDSILMAGDEESKIYSIAELRDGLVETQNGVIKMTDRQIESYYQKRTFFDEMHNIRSVATKRQLEIEGYENLKYVDKDRGASNLMGRRRKQFNISDVGTEDFVFFPGEVNTFHKGSSVALKKQSYIDDGYEVVELLQPVRVRQGKEATIALVKKESGWSRLPDDVLNYQAGYVPRIYPKGYFYVRDMASPNKEVLYAFPTRDKAKAFSDSTPDSAVFADREFNAVQQLVEDSNAFGGLYTGSRKTRPLMVKDGDKEFRPERMSVGNSTERYVQNISSIMPLNEYRATATERWKNTVNTLAESQGRSGLGREQRFDGTLNLEKDTKDVMEQARQYIQDNMKMPSREERVTERIALGAANMLYGKPFAAKPRQWLLDHSQGSVSDWIKGHSFNLHMGFFNLRQLFVQMQNASLSISMNPTLALPSMGDTLALRSIAMLPEAKAAQAAKHMKLGDDVVDSLREYNKSGLRDSIVRQADFDMNSVGISHGSIDAARKLSKAGRVFFNEGENFSRMLSWNIARRKWKAANPGKKMADKDIQETSQEALRLQMNLQSENAAWWQKAPGINVATQFLQVQAKFLENVMPRVIGGSTQWTPKEKAQALAGQLFLYGTVGVPVAEEAAAYVAELRGQSTQEFIAENPDFTDAINEGFVGMLGSLLGAGDLAPTESFSLLAGLDDNVVASIAEGAIEVFNGGYSEEGAIEMFTGPSANIIRRVGDVGAGVVLSMKSIYEVPTGDVMYQSVLSNLDDIAALTSTWTNARKLYTLNSTGRLMSSRGTLIATKEQLGPISLQTQLGIAMGFPTDVELQHYKNQDSVKSAMQFKKEALKELKGSLIDFANTGNQELYNAKKAVILAPFSATEKMDLLKSVNKDALAPATKLDRGVKAAQRLIIESGGRVKPNVAQSLLLEEEQN